MAAPQHVLRGVIAAMVTPMREDEELDLAAVPGLVGHLLEREGVHGLLVLGGTGELASLSGEEREQVVTAAIAAVARRVPVIVGVSGAATREVVRNSEAAEALGADAVLVGHPLYWRPAVRELRRFYADVASATGVPLILYNNPGATGVDLQPEVVAALVADGHVEYVKESSGDASRVTRLRRLCGDGLGVLCGADHLAFEAFAAGAQGFIAASANAIGRQAVELYRLTTEEGDLAAARALNDRLSPFATLIETTGKYVQLAKLALDDRGIRVGPPRRPLLPLDAAETTLARAALATARRPAPVVSASPEARR
jgi:4-hydroxy-tetrahydrodipicolinate synthase